jgi:pyridoxal phosphate enzyme (YggS family)
MKIINENIEKSALISGRNKTDISLIAVTKTVDVNKINFAIQNGITHIGENKVQEFLSKYDELLPVKKHLIGHLQTNKIKYIYDKIDIIQSVDSIKLAQEINKFANKLGRKIEILLQINIGDEESKFGIDIKNSEEFVEKLTQFDMISVRGFMCLAPYFDMSENARKYFFEMNEKYHKINQFYKLDMDILSMGMSNDYMVAIQEGATHVRIGSALFGQRVY